MTKTKALWAAIIALAAFIILTHGRVIFSVRLPDVLLMLAAAGLIGYALLRGRN